MSAILHIAAMLLAAGVSHQAREAKPLQLQLERDGKVTVIRVVGAAEQRMTAVYNLEVGSGGNKSVQKGVARLQPGVRTIVATVRLGGDALASAKLTVRPTGGAGAYEEAIRVR